MSSSLYTIHDSDLVTNDSLNQDQPYVLRLRDKPIGEKPREKLMQYGPEVLSAQELLAIILNVGTSKEDVMNMTHRILREYGEHTIAHETNVNRLMRELKLPETKACQIVACFALGRRFFKESPGRSITLRTAQQVYAHVRDMGLLPKEHLRGLYLNAHYKLIHDEIISIGSLTANIIHPREVFRPALEYNASAVIIAHNHPSGSVEPSQADVSITQQLTAAGTLLGIELLDHLIIGTDGYQSIIKPSTQPWATV